MKFQRFYEDELQMRKYFEGFRDKRKSPQIQGCHIARAIIYMPSFKLESLLDVDQWGRFPAFRCLIGSKRSIVASDSTLQKVLPQFEAEPIHATQKALYYLIVNRGLSKSGVSVRKRLRVAVVDGSGFGHHFSSVVSLGAFPLGIQPYENYGKELSASRDLLIHLTKYLGKSWCDILVVDGLYRAL